jgi:hypothetical protein
MAAAEADTLGGDGGQLNLPRGAATSRCPVIDSTLTSHDCYPRWRRARSRLNGGWYLADPAAVITEPDDLSVLRHGLSWRWLGFDAMNAIPSKSPEADKFG